MISTTMNLYFTHLFVLILFTSCVTKFLNIVYSHLMMAK